MIEKKQYEFNFGSKNADYFAMMTMSFALTGNKESAHRHLDYLIDEIN